MKKRSFSLLTMLLVICMICASGGAPARAAGSTLPGGLVRVGGSDRFATSSLIAETGWNKAGCVVIASADSYADALAGVPLAYALDAPVLLVRGNKPDDSVSRRIDELDPDRIYILGGTSAVSKSIEDSLTASGTQGVSGSDVSPSDVSGSDTPGSDTPGSDTPGSDTPKRREVVRISGKDRFETGINIALKLEELRGAPSTVFAVCADNYPDALAGGPAAALLGCPVIYVHEKADLSGLAGYVSRTGCRSVTILGGEAAVPKTVAEKLNALGLTTMERVAGGDRYQTALETVKRFNSLFTGNAAVVATGESYPDALAGGVLAAKLRSPLVLINNSVTVRGLYDYLASRKIDEMYALGGTSAVSEYALDCLRANKTMTTTTGKTTAADISPSGTAVVSAGKNAPYVYSPNYKSKYYIVVYENSQTVGVYGKDAKGRYSILVRSMKCSSGKAGTRTPKGVYSIDNKYRWRLMLGDVYAQYACRFNGDILFHSVLYEKQNASTLKAGSYTSLGKNVSHGCVRLCVRDAKWIYDNVPKGTQVRVVAANGPSGMALPEIKSGSKYSGWDPTDPDPKSPYNK